ncbi:DUF5689 domain-containing protein [Daejeonella oryzae]|uniref:DUF5689 domain-containing protein n=1 Tax=Daejeonella oryzae TaxID=1122943 RepID=UPI0012DDB38E|nr:DUF5689 domain-containing protein [Daejeonella oryzae]
MKNKYLAFLAVLTSMFVFTACMKDDPNPSEGVLSPYIAVEDVQGLYKGSDVSLSTEMLSGASKISGIVISDANSQNLPKGTIVLQQLKRGRTRGITLNVGETANIPYVIGDSVLVNVSTGLLTKNQGTLAITGVNIADIVKISSNATVIAKQVSLGELNQNFDSYQSTLVRIVGADITPAPVSGDTYSGDKRLNDGVPDSVVINLHTQASATFANNRVPANATFIGIPMYGSGSTAQNIVKQVRMRSIADVLNASGPLYANFPEDFESPDAAIKSSYNMAAIDNNITGKTGSWKLFQAILGTTSGRDRFNPAGKQSVRIQQNLSVDAYVQMNFDVPNGASKVTVSYGAYYTDAKSTWQLEYSTDAGITWTKIGDTISDAPEGSKTATFLMDISGPVRFRVNKLGLGTTNNTTIFNGRLSIEDFAIYSN